RGDTCPGTAAAVHGALQLLSRVAAREGVDPDRRSPGCDEGCEVHAEARSCPAGVERTPEAGDVPRQATLYRVAGSRQRASSADGRALQADDGALREQVLRGAGARSLDVCSAPRSLDFPDSTARSSCATL